MRCSKWMKKRNWVQIQITLLSSLLTDLVSFCSRSVHLDTPAHLFNFLLCFTVINTGYLYNISINDKFVGKLFHVCGHIVWRFVVNRILFVRCCFFCRCLCWATAWISLSRWISMRWTIFFFVKYFAWNRHYGPRSLCIPNHIQTYNTIVLTKVRSIRWRNLFSSSSSGFNHFLLSV